MAQAADPSQLEFWRQLSALREQLEADEELQRRFAADPVGVLDEQRIDLTLSAEDTGGEPTTFAALLEDLDAASRTATADALLRLSAIPERNRIQVVFPIVNVVVIANALALANATATANAVANANATANVNVRGMAGAELPSHRGLTVTLEAMPSDFVTRMSELGLSEERQRTLLRRTLTDPETVVERTAEAGGERVLARRAYRGVVFEATALVSEEGVRVTDARILAV